MSLQDASVIQESRKAQPTKVALFVSDVHLSPALPATTEAFLAFLHTPARQAQQLYLMGDIFEYWAGDDDADDPYYRRIIAALREVAEHGVAVFWIAGNRDFLVGSSFAEAAGLTLLSDPHVLDAAGHRIVLTHGDACCTDDAAYMAFRKLVRDPQWQQQFLAQPLAQRKQMVAAMREGSKKAQRGKPMDIMDVNTQEIASLFAASGATLMIHGHTHRPAQHKLLMDGKVCSRYVLPDWECEEKPERGGWLTLNADGQLHGHDARGSKLT